MTDPGIDDANASHARRLDSLYAIVYLDCIHVKTRNAVADRPKAIYLTLGINTSGEE